MSKSLSPLRYPGGKSKIYTKIKTLIENNAMNNRTYIEPFAGGFGIGIRLLSENIVRAAVLNDLDSHIYHFWFSTLNRTEEFLRLIKDTPITLDERERQKAIYRDIYSDELSDGFATLFLNRVNFSGVLKGGPIGGVAQTGTYKLDCRFNKCEISKKIEKIAQLKSRIRLQNVDAGVLIKRYATNRSVDKKYFFNIDPPYVIKGSQLYTNYFMKEDHISLEKIITNYLHDIPWILTYDECELVRNIYKEYQMIDYGILHNAGRSVMGKELVITNMSNGLLKW
ncbi:MAG: DNA adenine methylase [Flavobacteriaceae bacterium]|jgi:DNA adenine methylase|nr:DNA adenine methylase [Flavobacteriaceae bacterium]